MDRNDDDFGVIRAGDEQTVNAQHHRWGYVAAVPVPYDFLQCNNSDPKLYIYIYIYIIYNIPGIYYTWYILYIYYIRYIIIYCIWYILYFVERSIVP